MDVNAKNWVLPLRHKAGDTQAILLVWIFFYIVVGMDGKCLGILTLSINT